MRRPPPAADDIAREISNARHYLKSAIANEQSARDHERAHDWTKAFEAKLSFLRDLSAFLNAARTAKNYLAAATDAVSERPWLNGELAAPIFKFHADLAGVTFHEQSIVPTRVIVLSMPIERIDDTTARANPVPVYVEKHADGSMTMVPEKGQTHFIYQAGSLGRALAMQLAVVSPGPRPIVALATEYLDGLNSIFGRAVTEGRIK